jgi:endonuclease-3
LDHDSPFQLLIATILSAQCTDERVNMVTKGLFKAYPTSSAMAQAEISHLEELVRSAGFYQNKARNLKACSQALVEGYGGEVPRELEALIELAGVGRKTANVVLGNAFGMTSGIVVDTHVGRLSFRFGWTKSENPVIIERDLQPQIRHEDWILISHLLIFHGRQVCKARNPQCDHCFLFDLCPRRGVK